MKLLIVLSALLVISGVLAHEEFDPLEGLDLDDLDDLDEDSLDEDEALLRMIEEKRIVKQSVRSFICISIDFNLIEYFITVDPCAKIHCGAGRVCQTVQESAQCVCIPECPEESDPRRKACTNRNETWASDCEVHRQRCLCDTKDVACLDPKYSHIHINYYGECKAMQGCTEEEKMDFPRRMREWLFNVMRDLAERQELSKHYINDMKHAAESQLNKKWNLAAVWKFCDLDATGDRSVSRHELFPIRAPLMSLEHCISPFLEECDSDDDHRITLKEWGKCLELEDGDLEDRCEKIVSPADGLKSNEI
ncbi:unnamed protein product [Diamesa hyperborea]